MKKIIFLSALVLLFIGCEKDFNNTIEPQTEAGLADSVAFPFSIKTLTHIRGLLIVPNAKAFVLGIADTSQPIRLCELTVYNTGLNTVDTVMYSLDNGTGGDLVADDMHFNWTIPFSFADSNQHFKLTLRAKTFTNKWYYITQQSFAAVADKQPEVISIFAPDTIVVTKPDTLFLTAKVNDPDGLDDIASVFFTSIRPDGTSSGTEFSLQDNGVFPDSAIGDGKYSSFIVVDGTNKKGTYTFNFFAVDKADQISPKVSHKITIK
ncbi:MAG: hypothetical protein HYV28_07415 [Ignavibacteriales bacterium]|nr:hypothetical protein [Ignavibacteriales bacterium]